VGESIANQIKRNKGGRYKIDHKEGKGVRDEGRKVTHLRDRSKPNHHRGTEGVKEKSRRTRKKSR